MSRASERNLQNLATPWTLEREMLSARKTNFHQILDDIVDLPFYLPRSRHNHHLVNLSNSRSSSTTSSTRSSM